MKRGYFITGTDTEVGKTLVSVSMIHTLRRRGLRVAGMKPVASGCIETASGFRNADADMIFEAADATTNYSLVSRYRFLPAIAPHLAAQASGVRISLERIVNDYNELAAAADCVVVEGVGGWQVPVNEAQFMSDLAVALQLPVVIVVGGRLGCINHALLTAQSVEAAGLKVAGWVYNQIDPGMLEVDAVKSALKAYMPGDMLADIAFQENPDPAIIAASCPLKLTLER